jgi:hypothetical protein
MKNQRQNKTGDNRADGNEAADDLGTQCKKRYHRCRQQRQEQNPPNQRYKF